MKNLADPRLKKKAVPKEIKLTLERAPDPLLLGYGKYVTARHDNGTEVSVKVETVQGNIADYTQFEINGQYMISILEFYTQLQEHRRPSKEEKIDFATMAMSLETLENAKREQEEKEKNDGKN